MSKPVYRRLKLNGEVVGYSLELLLYLDNITGEWTYEPIKHDRGDTQVLSSPPMMKRLTILDIFPKRKRNYLTTKTNKV